MPKYDVLNQFIHPVTRDRINPGGSVDLPDTDGKRLIQAGCLRPAALTKAEDKKSGKKKVSKRRGAED